MGDAGPIAYKPGGVLISLGAPVTVQLPVQIVRARLTGMLFDTNKAFLLPGAIPGMKGLKKVFDSFKVLRVLVNGHASRTADAQYNLTLSDERAKAVAAYLQDKVDLWLPFYGASIPEQKRWGAHEDGLMLASLGFAGVKAFQEKNALDPDGKAGPNTRRALVEAYMKQPGTSLPGTATIETHGCGEFHREVETEDDVEEEKNRRVEVYFFEGEVLPKPQKKCPAPGCPEYPQWKASATKVIDLSKPSSPFDLTVTNKQGKPVPDARVIFSGPESAETITGGSGVAHFEGLLPGKYGVTVEREAFETVNTEVEVGSA